MSLSIGRSYHITTLSGVTSKRVYLGRNSAGQSLFGGQSNDGRRFTNRLNPSDQFVKGIRKVGGASW